MDQVLILSGDQLYRMDDAAFVDAHRARGAALTVAALPVDPAAAAGFGLMRADGEVRIRDFREKPTGAALDAMRVDTAALGLSSEEAARRPFLASMGGVPLGIGAHSVIQRAILDKNVRIGSHVNVINKDRVDEADCSDLGFTIRSGIVVIEKHATIPVGTVI